jgi:pyruvyltransferase
VTRKLIARVSAHALRAGRRVRSRAALALERDPIVAYWWRKRPNFGDALNPVLIERLTGKRPLHSEDLGAGYPGPVVAAIGSVLQYVAARNLVVWGAGFIRDGGIFRQAPGEIRAVRGPLTREVVLRQGIACPPVYGDPALLYPRFFAPALERTARLGVVPHYWDKGDPALARFAAGPGVRIIDVQRDANAVVAEILACQAIAASSLHAIVIALAYGIPAVWVEFSDRVEGAGFKFRDFFASIHAPVRDPLRIDTRISADTLVDRAVAHPIDLDVDRLLASCPFRLAASL